MHQDIQEAINKEIQRIAWRLQYYAKKESNQYPFTYDFTREESFEDELVLKLFVRDIIKLIKKKEGQNVINSLYLEGKTIKEISAEMNISVQAVNKWKRKTLLDLKERIS